MAISRDEWYFIVNPHAGSGKTMSKWVPAERKMRELGVPFYTVFTNYKHHAVELASTAARLGYRKIAAVGGDGSIHEVFNGILTWCSNSGVDPSEFYVAVVPIGSGNDWIKAVNIPNDTTEAIRLIAKGDFCGEDVIKVETGDGTDHYMANVGGVGFDSHVCMRVNRQKERGFRSPTIYFKALMHTIFHLKPIRIAIKVDGKPRFSGECMSLAFGNGKYSGGGLRQCNLADFSDGILDMIIVPKIPLTRLLLEIPRILKGTTSESAYVPYLRGKEIEVEPLDAQSRDNIELDGEIVGNLPAKFSVTGMKINVLCNKGE